MLQLQEGQVCLAKFGIPVIAVAALNSFGFEL